MKIVKLVSCRGEVCPTLSDYERFRNWAKILKTARYALHHQTVYAAWGFDVETRMMSSLVLIGGESDEEKKIWVRKVLSLSRYVVRGDN